MVWGKSLEDDFSREDIYKAFYECNGNVCEIAKALYCGSTYAIYRYLDIYPEAKEELNKSRHYKKEDLQDSAQLTLEKLMERIETDPSSAYKSATYLLNKLGKDRGFGEQKIEEQETNPALLARMSQQKSEETQ
jgi:hypothetical protein